MTKIYNFPKQEVIYLTEEVRRESRENEAFANLLITILGMLLFVSYVIVEYGAW